MGNVNEYKGQGRKYRRVMRRVVGRRASVQYYSSAGSGQATAQYGKGSTSGSATRWQDDPNNFFGQGTEGRTYVNRVLSFASTAAGRKIARFVLPLAILSFLCFKPAQSAHAAGILDGLQAGVKSTTAAWMNNSLAIGQTLFGIMMAITIVTALCRFASINGTLEGVGHSLMSLLLNIIPVFVVMTAMTIFLPNIVDTANQLAGQITGVPITGPSEIFGLGIAMCKTILVAATAPFTTTALETALSGPAAWAVGCVTLAVGLVTCFIIIAAFTIIAAEYLLCFLQAYIRLSIEAFNLGWSASPGTKHMAEAFLGEAKYALTRVILTIGIVAFIVAMVPHMTAMAASTDMQTIMISWLELAGGAALAAILAIKVPQLAHSGGQPSLSAPKIANETFAAASSGVSRIVRAAKAS